VVGTLSESEVRIAFVGCGMVSEMHAAAIERVPAATLAGVFDADEALTVRRSEQWSCRAFPSVDALLEDEAVDAVFVLTPTTTHVAIAITALDAGKHVLVEKPVAPRMAALEPLVARARTAPPVCMPGHNYAYIPEIARVMRLMREGRLGTIRLVSIVFAIAHEERVAAHYDGVLRLVMPHHAYLAYGLLGLPSRVHAGTVEPGWATLTQEDQCWMALDYPPHGTGLLFATLAVGDESADPWTFVLKVLGTEGSASATWRSGVLRSDIGSMSTGYAAYEEAYERQLEAFCQAVRGKREAILSPLDHAIGAERILSAAEEAVRLGRGVEIDSGDRRESGKLVDKAPSGRI
jgi:predicted dehydrogenase